MSVAPPPPVRLLLDEDLSPWAAHQLRVVDGVDAAHVRDRDSLGIRDDQVVDLAYNEDRILVTANVKDFQRLANARELHAGLVFVQDGGLVRAEQLELLRRVVAAIELELERGRDIVNRALFVEADGSFRFEDLPPLG